MKRKMQHKLEVQLLIALLLPYFILNVTVSCGLPTNGVAYVPYSTNTPSIDGSWTTTTEWTHATMIKVENMSTGWTFYLALKYNRTHVFVLLDFLSDQTPSTHDFGGIFFDSQDDGGNLAGQDDYGFVTATGYPGFTSIYQGTGNGNTPGEAWTQIVFPMYDGLYRGGFSGSNDPYESRDHRIMEFAVSRQWFNDAQLHYGFYAFVSDRHSGIPWPNSTRTLLEWPTGSGGKNIQYEVDAQDIPPTPEKWGDIVFYEDVNDLYNSYIDLQNNLTTLEKNFNASLVSKNSLQSELDQIESNYISLDKQFKDLQTAYTNVGYFMYFLLAIVLILATTLVYLTRIRRKPT